MKTQKQEREKKNEIKERSVKKQDVGGIRKLRIRRKERQNSRENNKGEKKSENKWLAFGRDT